MLLDDLHALTEPLDLDDSDLGLFIQLLENAAQLAVPSLLGWTLRFTIAAQPLSLTSIHPRVHTGDVCASMHVPLAHVLSLTEDGRVTLYASQPAAFTTLAADLAAALHLPADRICLDQDLQPDLTSGITGLRELSAMNQAIGELVDRGHTIASARTQLNSQSPVTNLDAHRRRKAR